MLKNLYAAFSRVGEFDGWVIAQLSARIRADYFFDGREGDVKNGTSAEVKKQKKDFAVIQAEDEGVGVVMKMFLMKPTKQEEKIPVAVCDKLGTLRFESEEILRFVELVQDSNPIHRTENPVVPGLLIWESIWKMYCETHRETKINRGIKQKYVGVTGGGSLTPAAVLRVEMRFFAVVYAGENIEVCRREPGLLEGCADRNGERILLWRWKEYIS